jgi:hypothetical protein
VGRFPPGWPIILAVGERLGVPSWLVNPILSALVLWVLFLYANRLHGQKVAAIATASVLFSSFFLFNGASYFSHMSALLLILLFYYHGTVFLETGLQKYAVLAGVWIGFAFINRPYSAMLVGIPLLVYSLLVWPRRVWSGVGWLALGCTPFILFLLFYNHMITGDAFLFVTKWMDPQEGIGFVKGHDWKHALLFTFHHLIDFMLWASPTLLFLLPMYLFRIRSGATRLDKGWNTLEFTLFPVLAFGYAFYYLYGGDQYGPRFYFEAYPYAVLVVSSMIFGRAAEETSKGTRADLFRFLYVVGAVFAIMYIPLHTMDEHQAIKERMDVYRLVESRGVKNAIILLSGEIRRIQTRNGTDLTGDVLYALDLGEESNGKLHAYFPSKRMYRYFHDEKSPEGVLVEISSN